jgi:hypothetical protein
MTTESLKLHRRARFALQGLDPAEQARVRERLAQLANLPRSEWPAEIASRFGSHPSRYLVRVDDEWRLIVGEDNDGRPEVEDIVSQGRLDFYAESSRKNGP